MNSKKWQKEMINKYEKKEPKEIIIENNERKE